MTAQTDKKFFTVEEANKMLPLVRSIVRDLVEKYATLSSLHERLELLQNSSREGMSAARLASRNPRPPCTFS